MMMVTMGSLVVNVLVAAFLLCALLMMLVILIQKPKGGGLGGAFGGAGGGGGGMENAAFGAKTGDVLTGLTVVLFVMFMGLGVSLVFAVRADATGEAMPREVETINDGSTRPLVIPDDDDDEDEDEELDEQADEDNDR